MEIGRINFGSTLSVMVIVTLAIFAAWALIRPTAKQRAAVERQTDLERQAKLAKRQEYLTMLAEFRWDPNMSPYDFERLCAEYLCLKGWFAETTRASGDQGVDVVAKKSGIMVILQCKMYSQPISNKAVQEAYAGKAFAKAHIAAVVSNMGYRPSARALAAETGVLLLHFTDLVRADELFGILEVEQLASSAAPSLDTESRKADLKARRAEEIRLRTEAEKLYESAQAQKYQELRLDRVTRLCPRCETGLRLPRGHSGQVRCPECWHLFSATT